MTGKDSSKTESSSKNDATPPKEKSTKSIFRWLAFGASLIAVLAIAIAINIQYTDSSTGKFARALDVDNDDLKINWDQYPNTDIRLSSTLTDSDLTITKSGVYHLTGSLNNKTIAVKSSNANVKLILDNVTIENSTGPVIACYSADELVIEFTGENTLTDGTSYSAVKDEDVTGLIYSKSDLTLQGQGTLKLNANYEDAIVGKDDVKLNGGLYYIAAKDDAVRGKDSVYVTDGEFVIEAGADAFKSTNETDKGKGFVLIEKGDFAINAGAKGIKATKEIIIDGGYFTIDTHDDAIHSDDCIGITGGHLNISSNDDGIHANSELIIDGGIINIAKSYEGIESQVVTINNGELNIIASDDGINAGGGDDASATNREGANPFNVDEDCILSINGGTIYINASGDGVDSNGWLYINGGTTTVDGPIDDGNGALDSGMGIVMNGGSIVAVGSSGMAETISTSSLIHNVSIFLSAAQPAGTTVEIKDSSENTIVSHISAKTFSNITLGSPNFQLGGTYYIYLNGELYDSFTISKISNIVGETYINQPAPMNSRAVPQPQ